MSVATALLGAILGAAGGLVVSERTKAELGETVLVTELGIIGGAIGGALVGGLEDVATVI